MTLSDTLARNLDAVCGRIQAACDRAGRSPSEVRLVAVSKYARPEWIRGLYDLGCRDFGESRPQQLVQRAGELPDDVRWHLIGHLQRNKAAGVWPHVVVMHSVDSQRLIDKLNDIAAASTHQPAILLEVNVSGEASKDGFKPDELRGVSRSLLSGRDTLSRLDIAGLMTMAPLADDPEAARPVFRALRNLRDELQSQGRDFRELSMGMSGDFEVAIEEGATMVRIGSALFEGLEASI